jgi:hypothetical protein
VILTPLMAPRAKAHAERWIGSCRRECPDWMLIASEGRLRRVRGDPIPRQRGNTINRRERLGGLLSEYYVEPKPA